MYRQYCPENLPQASKAIFWTEACSSIFFPLDAKIGDSRDFEGLIRNWAFEHFSLTWFRNGPVRYVRERRHLTDREEEQILISFALQSPVCFTQEAATLNCGKGRFVIQRGKKPYEYDQADANELLVFKVPLSVLEQRVRSVDRYSMHVHRCDSGAGGLLVDMLRALPRRLSESDDRTADGLGACLVDLLGLALEGDARAMQSEMTSVQQAHLVRIDSVVRRNFARPDISPASVAAACGISVRYLHALCRHDGMHLSERIRQLRLQAADAQLADGRFRESISEIAYRWGFSDQAQFSKAYKARFGHSPKERRSGFHRSCSKPSNG